MVDWPRKLEEGGFGELPQDIQKNLRKIEGMPGDPASVWLKKEGFMDIRDEDYRRGRFVGVHEDLDGLVFKIAVDDGQWQNEIEGEVWQSREHPSYDTKVPEEAMGFLAPVLEHDKATGDVTWLIMERADMEAPTEMDAIQLVENMLKTDWVVTDFHPDNIGYIRGEPKFIDYGQLRPKRFLREGWREAIKGHTW